MRRRLVVGRVLVDVVREVGAGKRGSVAMPDRERLAVVRALRHVELAEHLRAAALHLEEGSCPDARTGRASTSSARSRPRLVGQVDRRRRGSSGAAPCTRASRSRRTARARCTRRTTGLWMSFDRIERPLAERGADQHDRVVVDATRAARPRNPSAYTKLRSIQLAKLLLVGLALGRRVSKKRWSVGDSSSAEALRLGRAPVAVLHVRDVVHVHAWRSAALCARYRSMNASRVM